MSESAECPPSLAGAAWLADAGRVLSVLADAGFEARVVGGAVRNGLIGEPVSDVDIATSATPEQVMAAAVARGLRCVPTRIDHGTVTLIAGSRAYEVTTLREDVETDGRHARVAFTADWAADARRRDFTINALYCDQAGVVLDPLGGFGDLLARRVRFIGDPSARIREDNLRILRFFRFFAAYGVGPIDTEGRDACIAERDGLDRLAAERIRAELMRLLVAPRAVEAVAAMHEAGLWPAILGLAPRPGLLARVAGCEGALGWPGNATLRLSALAAASIEGLDALAGRLRLSNDERSALVNFDGHDGLIDKSGDPRADRYAIYRLGSHAFSRRLLASWAVSDKPIEDERWRARLVAAAAWQPPRFPLGGDDVLGLGVPAGPRVGQLLGAVERWWLAEDFAPDAEALRARLRALAKVA